MLYTLGLVVSLLVWLFKGNSSMKQSYNNGRNDFLEMIKGEEDVNSK